MENHTPEAVVVSEEGALMKLTSPKQLLIESFATFKKTWKLLVRIGVLVAGPAFLLAAMVMGIALAGYSVVAMILGFVLILTAVYFFSWAYAAVLYALSLPEGQAVRARDAYKQTAQRVWPMVGVSILTSLIVMGGILLLIIPGIIFSVWYGMSRYIVVTEGLSPVESLKRSRAYVDGYFWPVIIRFLVIIALGIAVGFVSEIISVTVAFGSTIIADIISMAISIVWSIYSMVYGYKVYVALKEAYAKKA